jgi:hypothetical protein
VAQIALKSGFYMAGPQVPDQIRFSSYFLAAEIANKTRRNFLVLQSMSMVGSQIREALGAKFTQPIDWIKVASQMEEISLRSFGGKSAIFLLAIIAIICQVVFLDMAENLLPATERELA